MNTARCKFNAKHHTQSGFNYRNLTQTLLRSGKIFSVGMDTWIVQSGEQVNETKVKISLDEFMFCNQSSKQCTTSILENKIFPVVH